MNEHELIDYFVNLDEEKLYGVVQKNIKNSLNVQEILNACKRSMELIGVKFEEGEYYIADMLYAASIFKKITEMIKPTLKVEDQAGTIIMATVKNDVHDIGKNLVITVLSSFGFKVIDLGVDVQPVCICQSIKEQKPEIVGLSCMLSETVGSIKETISQIKNAGLREKVKIIVGGAIVNAEIAEEAGADAYGENAFDAISLCQKMIGGELRG